MYYTIYKTTNLINNKFYIGKHQTTDLKDGYLGSGKFLKRAIKKYGIENFKKEILHIFNNEEEMNQKERELVIISEDSYNLCEGGKGGFGYISKNLPNGFLGKKHSEETKQKMREARSKQVFSEETKQKISKLKIGNKIWLGRKHSAESKLKMSLAKNKKLNYENN